MKYKINEIFYSLQGEGVQVGEAQVFVRFAGCNLACSFCDTEFESFRELTAEEILAEIEQFLPGERMIVTFTGGEPLLSLDKDLAGAVRARHFIAIETNGSQPLTFKVDWVTCSPKVAEHAIKLDYANEVRYVRAYGQGIPKPRIKATYHTISPAFEGDRLPRRNLEWCVELVKANPTWRLSVQAHKLAYGGIR